MQVFRRTTRCTAVLIVHRPLHLISLGHVLVLLPASVMCTPAQQRYQRCALGALLICSTGKSMQPYLRRARLCGVFTIDLNNTKIMHGMPGSTAVPGTWYLVESACSSSFFGKPSTSSTTNFRPDSSILRVERHREIVQGLWSQNYATEILQLLQHIVLQ